MAAILTAISRWIDLVAKLVLIILAAFATDHWLAHYVAVSIVFPILAVTVVEGASSVVEWVALSTLSVVGRHPKLIDVVIRLATFAGKLRVFAWLVEHIGYNFFYTPLALIIVEFPIDRIRVAIAGVLLGHDMLAIEQSIEDVVWKASALPNLQISRKIQKRFAPDAAPIEPIFDIEPGPWAPLIILFSLLFVILMLLGVTIDASMDKERRGIFGSGVLNCIKLFIIMQCALLPCSMIIVIEFGVANTFHSPPHWAQGLVDLKSKLQRF